MTRDGAPGTSPAVSSDVAMATPAEREPATAGALGVAVRRAPEVPTPVGYPHPDVK